MRDRARAVLPAALVVAAALVVFRALVYLRFEQLGFDSDQAINGLMAKHLSQGRAFPLFFYGQSYMLAVEAWVAVPFFWIAGPTVGALRWSMLTWNLAFALLLIVGLHRGVGLRPWTALVPALFFLAAPASVAKALIEAQGGIIEPFVYIGLLWFLRERPLWFGAVLAIGFRNREFTIYAVPVLLVLELLTGGLTRERVRDWLLSLVMLLAVWESIEAVMPFADLAGPGTRGQLLGGFTVSQVDNLMGRFNGGPDAIVDRVPRMIPELLAWFSGAAQEGTNLPLRERPWLTGISGICVLAAMVRLVTLTAPRAGTWADRSFIPHIRAQILRASFAWYLVGVGLVAVTAFVAAKPVVAGYSRYGILGLLIPIGMTAALLAIEPSRLLRRGVMILVIAWAALAVADHARVLMANVRQPPENPIRELVNGLVDRHVAAASAGYWQAYVATFIAQERVYIASSDFVRIQQYQDIFAERLSDARFVEDRPCPGGERVARWYLCLP